MASFRRSTWRARATLWSKTLGKFRLRATRSGTSGASQHALNIFLGQTSECFKCDLSKSIVAATGSRVSG